jgi:hypothetical protein
VIVVDVGWLKSPKVAHQDLRDGTDGSPAGAQTVLSSRQCQNREKFGMVKMGKMESGTNLALQVSASNLAVFMSPKGEI